MSDSGDFSIFDVAADDDTTVVDVAGEIDMETGPAFQDGLLRAIGAGRGVLATRKGRPPGGPFSWWHSLSGESWVSRLQPSQQRDDLVQRR